MGVRWAGFGSVGSSRVHRLGAKGAKAYVARAGYLMRLRLPLVTVGLLLLSEGRIRVLRVRGLVRPSLQRRHVLRGRRECEMRSAPFVRTQRE